MPLTPTNNLRPTTAQRETIVRLLAKGEYIRGPNDTKTRTGYQWRGLFKATGTPDPSEQKTPRFSQEPSWPTVDEWINTLTKKEASAAISHLLREQGDEDEE